MAPIKRKGEATSFRSETSLSKRQRTNDSDTTSKKQHKKSVQQPKSIEKNDSHTSPKESSSFITNTNEPPAFPRGGASALTPVERKQIQAQADRDVLFEQGGNGGDATDSDVEIDDDKDAKQRRNKKSSKKSKKRGGILSEKVDSDVKIEGLSYKRIAPGSLLLGTISSINARDVAVSLPNNLTGFVPLTSVSSQLTAKIESLLDESKVEEEGSDSDTDDEIDLKSYVRVGQFVRVYVASTGAESTESGVQKKHIELSLDPGLCNIGMKQEDVVLNSTLQASVHSVEDHGLIMDLGLADQSVRGFIPMKELGVLQLSQARPGMVFLCQVISSDNNGRTIKLSLNAARLSNYSKSAISTAPTVDSFLPGTAVEILLSEVTPVGLAGKVMGMLDVIADIVHSTARKEDVVLTEKFRPGDKLKARLISTFPLSDSKKLGFSLMDNVLKMETALPEPGDAAVQPKISEIIPNAVVSKVDPGMGLYVSLNNGDFDGFVHISSLSDKKIESLYEDKGPYKIGSSHKARITGFNSFDGLFLLSMQESILSRPFLRIEDVQIGQVVKGKIRKLLISEKGLSGLLVDLVEGITGLVPHTHFSDIQLQHPERKFREGLGVTCRVLSVETSKRQIRLTLKKSLVNSDADCWKTYEDIQIGHTAPGTLSKINPHGAVVQFFGSVRGYLPVSEMSEAFIKDATQHFREGQVVTVNAIHVDVDEQKLTLSCRDPQSVSSEESIRKVQPGTLAVGTVFEKSDDDLLLRLDGSDAIGRLELDHTADGSEKKRRTALSKIRVGQKLQDLLILEVLPKRRIVRMSNKSSLIQAAKDGELLTTYGDLREGKKITGLITNIAAEGVFIGYAAGITGFLPKKYIPSKDLETPDFAMTRLQPVSAFVTSIDYKNTIPRFWLSLKNVASPATTTNGSMKATIAEPVDSGVMSMEDLTVGVVTKARIVSVKDTQLNVELAKDVQGRIDVSELFDHWEDIKDRKRPLRIFDSKQILPVRILGAHDARNHRFLPITHRSGKAPVFELSAKPSFVKADELDILTLEKVKVGSSWIAYVNNIAENYLWVNLSPNVRGRIAAMDVTDDLSLLADMETNFPIGSALKVHVTGVDVERNRLDLSAKHAASSSQVTLKDISKGMILPGRVTKCSERQVIVQLSENVVGAVNLIDIADDFNEANPDKYQKNDIVRVCVLAVDVPNKKLTLSLRPSRVLSSSLTIKDPEVSSISQLSVNDLRRGFITNITEKGVFVALGVNVTAFVRVSNLSDRFLKEWQEHFQRDQLVEGRVITLDAASSHVQMSLKESVLKSDYKPPLAFTDLQVGQIITGKVVKVEEFGVFILVDNSSNVRGLCHRSEIADQRIEDVQTLFNEGDPVKAKVLKVEPDKRRVNFGLKATYFASDDDVEMESLDSGTSLPDDDVGGVDIDVDSVSGDSDNEDEYDSDEEEVSSDDGDMASLKDDQDEDLVRDVPSLSKARTSSSANPTTSHALKIGGFEWAGIDRSTFSGATGPTDSDHESVAPKPKKKKKAQPTMDRTGDLDLNGPQSADDYERLLLSEPDSSVLWLQYMAFHLELGEVDQARQLGQRAIQTIGLGLDAEKLNLWVALLNLENTYGDDDSITETFKRACEYNDVEEIHSRLASIYIQSGKLTKADEVFQAIIKKFSQNPKTWINYATFLFDSQSEPERGRQLLARALQTLPKHTHIEVTSKFAALEFRSSNGDAERGRTIFEGLLDSFPKRVDLWNVLLDLELKYGGKEQVRGLFERIFSTTRIKNKQAKFFFKRWLEYEEKEGDERSVDQVKVRAAEYVKQAAKA